MIYGAPPPWWIITNPLSDKRWPKATQTQWIGRGLLLGGLVGGALYLAMTGKK